MKKFSLILNSYFLFNLISINAMAPADNYSRGLTMQDLEAMEQQATKADTTANRFYITSSSAAIATSFLVKNTLPLSTLSNIAEFGCISAIGFGLTKILYECGKETKKDAVKWRSTVDFYKNRIARTEAPRTQAMTLPPSARVTMSTLPVTYENNNFTLTPSSSENMRRRTPPPPYQE